jgi:hypothetical protein
MPNRRFRRRTPSSTPSPSPPAQNQIVPSGDGFEEAEVAANHIAEDLAMEEARLHFAAFADGTQPPGGPAVDRSGGVQWRYEPLSLAPNVTRATERSTGMAAADTNVDFKVFKKKMKVDSDSLNSCYSLWKGIIGMQPPLNSLIILLYI